MVDTKANSLFGAPQKINNGVGTTTNVQILYKELNDPLINSYRHQIQQCRKPKRASTSSKVGAILITWLLFLAKSVSGVYENLDFENWN